MVMARDPTRYRPNVGLALFHPSGRVLYAKRINTPPPFLWQMPQGGIDPSESPEAAAFRELEEEIGVRPQHAEILEELDEWLYYDFPPSVRSSLSRGDHLGQRQKWFALRFTGKDRDIRLDMHTPEFSDWRWGRLEEAPSLVVPFKRPVYEAVAARFAAHAIEES
jgi:putative (di)nucleoside polyphosphate hydrolase